MKIQDFHSFYERGELGSLFLRDIPIPADGKSTDILGMGEMTLDLKVLYEELTDPELSEEALRPTQIEAICLYGNTFNGHNTVERLDVMVIRHPLSSSGNIVMPERFIQSTNGKKPVIGKKPYRIPRRSWQPPYVEREIGIEDVFPALHISYRSTDQFRKGFMNGKDPDSVDVSKLGITFVGEGILGNLVLNCNGYNHSSVKKRCRYTTIWEFDGEKNNVFVNKKVLGYWQFSMQQQALI